MLLLTINLVVRFFIAQLNFAVAILMPLFSLEGMQGKLPGRGIPRGIISKGTKGDVCFDAFGRIWNW